MLFLIEIFSNIKKQKLIYFVNFLCFLFFSLFLIYRKSYSIVLFACVVVTAFTFRQWWGAIKSVEVKRLAIYFLVISFVWSHSFDTLFSWSNEGDYLVRYGLGALCALGICSIGVDKKFLYLGIAIGAIASGFYALIQFPVLGRAEGYTNAIRFGNIALLMSVFLIFFAISIKKINLYSISLLMAAIMGLIASFLSLSRGGWLFLAFLPFISVLMFDGYKKRLQALGVMLVIAFVALVGLMQLPFFESRVQRAEQEVQGYFTDKEQYVATSVGARLEQWQLSWKLGQEKPWLGWGDKGVSEGRKLMVERGEAHPTALNFPHTHHEFLEMWATRGFFGVIFLLFIYLVPFVLFFPTKNKIDVFPEKNKESARAIYIAGICIPLAYFVFGLTDVFFNLSIGHVFMIFSMIFFMATLENLKNDKDKRY